MPTTTDVANGYRYVVSYALYSDLLITIQRRCHRAFLSLAAEAPTYAYDEFRRYLDHIDQVGHVFGAYHHRTTIGPHEVNEARLAGLPFRVEIRVLPHHFAWALSNRRARVAVTLNLPPV